MKYTFTGKNISIYDDVKAKVEKKLSRIQRLVPDDVEVFIAISKVRHLYKMEVSVPMHKRLLRAETTASDVNTCADTVVDVLEKQIRRYKGRLNERKRRNKATIEEAVFAETLHDDSNDVQDIVIHRTKRFALKPMDVQEAVMEMELLGHSFFVFRDATSDEVNVVYKRNDDEYGLIEPQ